MTITLNSTTRQLPLSLCQHCVWDIHPSVMLTTYAVRECSCDRCRRTSDLAMVGLDPDHPQYDDFLKQVAPAAAQP